MVKKENKKKFICGECGFNEDDEGKMVSHVFSHGKGNPLECDCGFFAARSELMGKHGKKCGAYKK